MSHNIKISDWSGDDKENAVKSLAKLFRMSEDEAEEVMNQIGLGQFWQFERSISDSQSKIAAAYLTRLGFEVERASSAEDILASFTKSESSSDPDSGLASKSGASGDHARPRRRISPFVKVVLAVVLLIGVFYGLSQTSFVKDFLAGSDSPVEVKRVAPVQPQPQPEKQSQPETQPQPQAEPQAQTQPEPKKEEKPKPPPEVKPLQGIKFEGKPSMKYPSTLAGCGGEENINFKLLSADLEQTQKDFFCKRNTIANPLGEWKCKFKSDSKMCPGKESYNCVRRYQCIPETPDFNRARFKREIEDLENLENEKKTGIAELTAFRGLPVDSKYNARTTTSLSGCYGKEELSGELRQSDLKQTQKDFFCKNNTIANPVGGWQCEAGKGVCIDNEEQWFNCYRSYQCIPETPEYNRAEFKRELEKS